MIAVAGGGSADADVTGYILHHLTNLRIGSGFWALNLDTLAFSVILGGGFLVLFRTVAVRATAGVPGSLQNFIEILLEFVGTQVRDTFHGDSRLVAPLAIDHFYLGLPDELYGPGTGRFIALAAQSGGRSLFESRTHHRHERYLRHVHRSLPAFIYICYTFQGFRRLCP